MEKTFTFRFYNVTRNNNHTPAMVDILRLVAGIADKTQREKLLATDYIVRLENLEDDGPNAVVGELTRCQNTNLPSEIDHGDRRPLEVERLGHSVVFRFNHQMGVLGIQYDPRIISPGRVLEYLSAFNAAAIYEMQPRINEEAWAKFNAGETRKLSIRIANPDDMGVFAGPAQAASDSFRAMGDAYGAPLVTVEISMGHHRGFLSNAVRGLAAQLANMNFPGVRLDRLTAKTVVNDASEEIDLIEDRVVARETLEIHDRDPDINWQVKRNYLNQTMQQIFG
ncbi:hypothetical protein [Mesorhizobium sp. B2-7-2]|uniref:hypothetical protein n=1 Tax=Mesorhizobium sp. B2-7-2 TaxID=2589908 RepID=UPI0011295981|nr:hypothetical protein [Mesorhizobium sp. B2-7-2]TPJ21654.1 hypothetical protein FJ425_24715 [Mesorhizobium sp. B2-7-2]